MHIFHKWKLSHGTHNLYYECECGRRKVVIGQGGYQPVDWNWLGINPDHNPYSIRVSSVLYGRGNKRKSNISHSSII